MGVYMVNIFIHVTFQFNQILGIDPKYVKIFNVSKEFAGFQGLVILTIVCFSKYMFSQELKRKGLFENRVTSLMVCPTSTVILGTEIPHFRHPHDVHHWYMFSQVQTNPSHVTPQHGRDCVFALISIPPRGAWHGIAAVRSLF
jgi:hypothetical protein